MVFETIRRLLADQLDIDEDEITMESTLLEDLGADSIELVDLIMSVEESSLSRPATVKLRKSMTLKSRTTLPMRSVPSETQSAISRTWSTDRSLSNHFGPRESLAGLFYWTNRATYYII